MDQKEAQELRDLHANRLIWSALTIVMFALVAAYLLDDSLPG